MFNKKDLLSYFVPTYPKAISEDVIVQGQKILPEIYNLEWAKKIMDAGKCVRRSLWGSGRYVEYQKFLSKYMVREDGRMTFYEFLIHQEDDINQDWEEYAPKQSKYYYGLPNDVETI